MGQIYLDLTEDPEGPEARPMVGVDLLGQEVIGGPLPQTDYPGTVISIGAAVVLEETDTAQLQITQGFQSAA